MPDLNSAKLGVAIITHGRFGEELLSTSQDIVGKQDKVLAFSVTSETGMDNVCRFIDQAMKDLQPAEGVLFLVDMLGGTPCNATVLKTQEARAEIVTGINLYMLISAFTHRTHLDLRALALKVAEDGKRAIGLPKDLLVKKAGG
jgi:PTS system mannose-specific IIA component